jgi:hypothetical protein
MSLEGDCAFVGRETYSHTAAAQLSKGRPPVLAPTPLASAFYNLYSAVNGHTTAAQLNNCHAPVLAPTPLARALGFGLLGYSALMKGPAQQQEVIAVLHSSHY